MSYNKNQSLDEYLKLLAVALQPSEEKLLEDASATSSALPTVVKIGSPRVGGTLLTQWASTGNLFYNPTNLHSRFYAVPIVGALMNRLLADPSFDYRDEFGDICRQLGFGSSIGKTSGVLAPHEFWYFWRHFLHITDVPCDYATFLERSDFCRFEKSMKGIQHVEGKSLFLKGHLVNFLLEPFHSKMSNMIYFHLKRSIIDTARSLYCARVEWMGDSLKWFSHKPPEYEILSTLDPYHQVVGQIYFIEREMQRVSGILGDRYFESSYVDFCRDPKGVYLRIADKMDSFCDREVIPKYTGPSEFSPSHRSSSELDRKLESALAFFIREYGEIDVYEDE